MRKSIFIFAVFICCFAQSFVIGQNNAHSQNNNNGGQTEQSHANQNITITEPVKVLLEPDREQIEAEKGYKTRQEKRDEANATWNRTGVIINSLLFVLVLIQALFSYRALKEVQRQANTMETQAETMKGQAQTMREQSETMNKQFGIMQGQTRLMEESLEETRRTISENYRTFQIGNRAYIGGKEALLTHPVLLGNPIKAEIVLINKGNTPALEVNAEYVIDFIDANITEMPPLIRGEDSIASSTSLSKDGDFNFVALYPPVDEKLMNSFIKGECWLYVWGVVRYKDVFNESHKTNFCVFQWYGEGKRLNVYSIGNDAT